MKQLTRDEAVEFANRGKWKTMTHKERAKFQIHQERLCMPFGIFQEAVEKTVGYPVLTHEFVTRNEQLKIDIDAV